MIERFHHVYYADEQNAIIVVCRGRGSPDLFLQPKKKKKKKVQVFTAGFCYGILTTDRWIQRGARETKCCFSTWGHHYGIWTADQKKVALMRAEQYCSDGTWKCSLVGVGFRVHRCRRANNIKIRTNRFWTCMQLHRSRKTDKSHAWLQEMPGTAASYYR